MGEGDKYSKNEQSHEVTKSQGYNEEGMKMKNSD
jgi:hypothetical protein